MNQQTKKPRSNPSNRQRSNPSKRLLDLQPNPRNPRRISDERLSALQGSLRKFGDLGGIVFNVRTGRLVGGHQRVKALDGLGFSKADVKIEARLPKPSETGTVAIGYVRVGEDRIAYREVNWDELTETAANLAANKHGGEWDNLLLHESLLSLEGWGDITLTGFDVQEIERIASKANPEGNEKDAEAQDNFRELRKKWKAKPGNLWRIGRHRLICGDSTDEDNVERLLEGALPHLMVTDPPYGVEYDADWRNSAMRADGTSVGGWAVGQVLNDDRADWTAAWDLFPGDVAYVWHAGTNATEVQRSIEKAQFEIRAQIIWAKQQFVIGRGDYHWKHEPCWYAVRKGKPSEFIGDRTQTTLWEIDKPHKSETWHSTQKPLECMARAIRNHSGEVYEPFAGSGTTIVAAENLGRRSYACELSPDYCCVILDRLSTAFPGIEIELL